MREVEVCGCCWELFMSSSSMTELGPSLLIFSLLIFGFQLQEHFSWNPWVILDRWPTWRIHDDLNSAHMPSHPKWLNNPCCFIRFYKYCDAYIYINVILYIYIFIQYVHCFGAIYSTIRSFYLRQSQR